MKTTTILHPSRALVTRQISQAVKKGKSLCVFGMPGIGKTALAKGVAEDVGLPDEAYINHKIQWQRPDWLGPSDNVFEAVLQGESHEPKVLFLDDILPPVIFNGRERIKALINSGWQMIFVHSNLGRGVLTELPEEAGLETFILPPADVDEFICDFKNPASQPWQSLVDIILSKYNLPGFSDKTLKTLHALSGGNYMLAQIILHVFSKSTSQQEIDEEHKTKGASPEWGKKVILLGNVTDFVMGKGIEALDIRFLHEEAKKLAIDEAPDDADCAFTPQEGVYHNFESDFKALGSYFRGSDTGNLTPRGAFMRSLGQGINLATIAGFHAKVQESINTWLNYGLLAQVGEVITFRGELIKLAFLEQVY